MRVNLDIRKSISLGIVFAFLFNMLRPVPVAFAQQDILPLPPAGQMMALSESFHPVVMRGLKVDSANPFRFNFIVDEGDTHLSAGDFRDEANKVIKYFLTSLTIPDDNLWVNLSPYEKDRIIPQTFGRTAMGRDLLAQDYILKQITASLIYPERKLGKKFWDRVYALAQEKYGSVNIPINTFNKVWIVPDHATVYVHKATAFVVDYHLKVMLEEDYLSLSKHVSLRGTSKASDEGPYTGHSQLLAIFKKTADQKIASSLKNTPRNDTRDAIGSRILREIVIPELQKEVNRGKNFSSLRQIFYSLILATWYKAKLKQALLNQVYSDKEKVSGVLVDDPKAKEEIYQWYLQAFKKGVFNYIKDEPMPDGQVVPRKYFSGGVTGRFDHSMMVYVGQLPDGAMNGLRIDDIEVHVAVIANSQNADHQARLKAEKQLEYNLAQITDTVEKLTFAVSTAVGLGGAFKDFAQIVEEDKEKPLLAGIPSTTRIPKEFIKSDSGAYSDVIMTGLTRDVASGFLMYHLSPSNSYLDMFLSYMIRKVAWSYMLVLAHIAVNNTISVSKVAEAYVSYMSNQQSKDTNQYRRLRFFLSQNKIVARAFAVGINGDLIIYWKEPYIRQKLAPFIYPLPYWIQPLKDWRKRKIFIKNMAKRGIRSLKSSYVAAMKMPNEAERVKRMQPTGQTGEEKKDAAMGSPSMGGVHSYQWATLDEQKKIFEAVREQTGTKLIDYGKRFFSATKGLVSNDSNPSPVPSRMFQQGLVKDERGIFWILKKGYPESERLAYLLTEGRANLTEVRLLTRKEMQEIFHGITDDRDYYLTRVVTKDNLPVFALPQKNLSDAFSSIFVANIFIRKADHNIFNIAFSQEVPVAIDHEYMGLYQLFANKSKGYLKFITVFLLHMLLQVQESLGQPRYSYTTQYASIEASVHKLKLASLDRIGNRIKRMIKEWDLAKGIFAAEQLNADQIRKSILVFKSIKNIRTLAKNAGFKGKNLEDIVEYLEEGQQRLGHDVNEVWKILTGEDAGFDLLDKAMTDQAGQKDGYDQAMRGRMRQLKNTTLKPGESFTISLFRVDVGVRILDEFEVKHIWFKDGKVGQDNGILDERVKITFSGPQGTILTVKNEFPNSEVFIQWETRRELSLVRGNLGGFQKVRKKQDAAMRTPGGIDLRSKHYKITVENDGQDVQMDFSSSGIRNLNFDGVAFKINRIERILNPQAFLQS